MRLTVLRATLALLSSLVAAGAVAPRAAHAVPYEAFIDIETEDDLYDLLASEQISPETFDILQTLLERGVDLDRATREELYSLPNLTYDDVDAIIAYRNTQGYVGDPVGLVGAGALTEDKLLSIASFLIVRTTTRNEYQPRGRVLIATRGAQDALSGDLLPPIALRARARAGRHLMAGLAATITRNRIGAPVWEPNRGGLIADEATVEPHVPKFYVGYTDAELVMLAGTYRVGFGQRLTFDNSSDYTPHGIYADDQLSRGDELSRECRFSTGELPSSPCSNDFDYVSPDFRWSESLRGVAAGGRVAAGTGFIRAYGFASYTPRSIYQYEIVDNGVCPDARDDGNPACGAPPVYVRPEGEPLAPTAEHAYQTLPDAFAETVIGGNVTFYATRRNYVGVTAYGASKKWLIETPEGVDLDTQEWSRVPSGDRYGAVGANVGIGRGIYDIFAEATYSFDQMADGPDPIDGGGGPAAIVRVTRTKRKEELELSARYYSPSFVNPYAGPIAAPDELEGQRARGEHGIRGRYTGVQGALTLRGTVDLWQALAVTGSEYEYVPRVDINLRADLKASDDLGYGGGLRFQDKDVSAIGSGEDECYETTFEDNEVGESLACRGQKLTVTGRVRFTPDRKTVLTGNLAYSVLDDQHEPETLRQDVSAVVGATYRVNPTTRLRGRIRYRNEDISDRAYLEESLATSAELTLKLRKKDSFAVRGDLVYYLDDRARTPLRSPMPELWLGLAYQAGF